MSPLVQEVSQESKSLSTPCSDLGFCPSGLPGLPSSNGPDYTALPDPGPHRSP
jgi:hypothetical protein